MTFLKTRQLLCNAEVDYSNTEVDDRILPFVITLDEENSIFFPEPGENQKFCYIITAKGEDTDDYADLSHIVFGICNRITNEDLLNVTVSINEQPQDVVIGENVVILNPDPPTQCSGLKFDFPLNKVDGEMDICFEFAEVYPVGQTSVCLFGGDVTVNGQSICGPVCGGVDYCNANFYQEANVYLPVTVKPFATPGTPVTFCDPSGPIITPGHNVKGVVNGVCEFTVMQGVAVEFPITFGADTTIDPYVVDCLTAAGTVRNCTNCNESK